MSTHEHLGPLGGWGEPVLHAKVLHGEQQEQPRAAQGRLQRLGLPQVGDQVLDGVQGAAVPWYMEPED